MAPDRVRPSAGDVALAAAFTTFAVVEGLSTGGAVDLGSGPIPGLEAYLVIVVPAMMALAWRRQWPVPVAAGVVLANMITNVEGAGSTTLAVVVAAYSVGAYAADRRSFLILPLSVAVGVAVVGPAPGQTIAPSDLAALMVWVLGPWVIGRFVRDRADEALTANERADLLEREQVALLTAAAAEERVRLARELHDVVSHSISVVCIQTQAVRHRLLPDQVREAADLQSVEDTAREAMAELRRLFGVLRADTEAPLAPPPGLGELERLAQAVRLTGIQVHVHNTPTGPLPPGLDVTVYRIIQEALTNAMKHSEASAVEISVQRSSTGLQVQVDDNGVGLRAGTGGHGLTGIQERAELYGGQVLIGASPAGGVRVSAHLPLREDA